MSESDQPSAEEMQRQLEMAQSQLALYARDLKQTLDMLRESEERFRSIAHAASDAILVIDQMGRIEYANPASSRMFGYTGDELHGQELHTLLAPERYRAACQRGLAAFATSGEGPALNKLLEMEALHRDGHEIPIELTIAPLRLKGQWHAVGIVRDISERRRAMEKQRTTLIDTIRAMAHAVEQRDPYTAGHMQRVAEVAALIAREMGWDEERILGLRLGALIHDVGKIYVPAEILSRTGKLSDVEFSIIKAHPAVGFEIIKDVDFPWPVAKMILQHHEHLDGSGYPNRLQGEDIVMEARILTVADVLEAINSHRPYRPALGMSAALEELNQHAGTYYDAEVVAAALRVVERDEIAAIFSPRPH
jgi:PAS domain S-box-containing protein/putative nucleotidyltransferase with HDIG domain